MEVLFYLLIPITYLVVIISVIVYIAFSAAMLCLYVVLSGADPFP